MNIFDLCYYFRYHITEIRCNVSACDIVHVFRHCLYDRSNNYESDFNECVYYYHRNYNYK